MPKKKTAAKKGKMTKAAFVRTMPNDTPRAEVVAKAKEAGIPLTEDYVSKIRTMDNAKRKKKAASKSAPSGSPRGRGKAPAKKSRVLELVAAHPDWTADQISKAAGATASYVYTVWRKRPSGKGKAPPSSNNGATTEFYRAVKRVGGVGKAKELLATIEAYENA